MREKDLGIWQTWTWRQVADEVRALACGLAAQGFRRGDAPRDHRRQPAAAVLVDGRRAGVGRHCRCRCTRMRRAAEFVFVLNDAEIAYADRRGPGAGRQDARGEAAGARRLQHIYYDDPRGLRNYEGRHELRAIAGDGPRVRPRAPGFFDGEVAQGQRRRRLGDALHVGHDRQAERRVPDACGLHRRGAGRLRVRPADGRTTDILSYLPMAWVGDHLFSYAQALVAGFTINCPESGDTVMTDLREIGPTYYFAPPRVFENLLTQVMIRMEDASAVKRWLFHYFMAVAQRCGAEILDGKPVSFADRLLYALGNVLIYGPLRNVLGMSRIRVAYTAGAAIGPDLFRFYRSIGINLKQLYGSTETCAAVCLQPDGEIKFDTRRQAARRASRSRSPPTAKCWCAGHVCSRNTTSDPMRPPSRSMPRAISTPATPASSTTTGTSRSSIARRTSASSRAARCSRPTTSRTSSSSSRTSRRRSRSATSATWSARSSTSTWARSATGRSGAVSPTRATPISRRSRRSTS